ncbi:MAG: recombination protein RecR [Candidatus Taylorbacteria bacterium]|nr:recombination protein RecR [Candidatus Taylorbacteria bacterium]
MNVVDKLAEAFKDFPGIGPRQAKRFVYYLLSRNNGYLDNLSKMLAELKREIKNCPSCFRFYPSDSAKSPLCLVCRSATRDKQSLLIVSRDVDLEVIEKSHSYNGYYFVLGGTVPILEKEPEKKIRINELEAHVRTRASEGLKEIIIATSVNPEGENTADFIIKFLSHLVKELNLKISCLGRGLSTGTELEYSDSDTIKNALKNRA